jgi:hypothetical protein
MDTEILNGALLQVGVAIAAGDGRQHLARPRRVALRKHEQRTLLQPR